MYIPINQKNIMKDILLKLIELSGLSKKEVAEKAGLPSPRIYEWCKGEKKIKFESLQKIANALGYELEVKIIDKFEEYNIIKL